GVRPRHGRGEPLRRRVRADAHVGGAGRDAAPDRSGRSPGAVPPELSRVCWRNGGGRQAAVTSATRSIGGADMRRRSMNRLVSAAGGRHVRRRRCRVAVLILAGGMLGGCAAGPAEHGAAVSDSAGVRIVENYTPEWP